MASLYSHKEANIRKTWLLFTGFLITVIGFGWVLSQVYNNPEILYIFAGFSMITSLVSYWYSDKIVLAMARATPVDMKSNPELYRMVENLAMTAGLPMPKVYTVPERALNAFATGRNPEHSVIAVTEGALQALNRTELEGVLAHELSHIGNRDMLVGTVAVILVGFISLISDMFLRQMVWGGMRRDNDRSGGPIYIVLAIVVSVLAPISATLMQLAISRRRESLADTSGALLTRYPEGLASALEKIGKDMTPMRVANNTTSHLWIDDPFTGQARTSWFHRLFMTHPPIEERIKALRDLKI
ncbi:MAG: M48 family metallopeptidase [Patescibacteria group bacterium]